MSTLRLLAHLLQPTAIFEHAFNDKLNFGQECGFWCFFEGCVSLMEDKF